VLLGERERERERERMEGRERKSRKELVSRSCFMQVVVAVTSSRAGSRYCFRVSWNGLCVQSSCKYKTSWAVAF